MLDHFAFQVPAGQYDEIVNWYLAALGPLGYAKQHDFGKACGLGPSKEGAAFWIGQNDAKAAQGFHVAFRAADRATVDKFYEAAINAGGKDNGKPGVRDQYHANYYGAFVTDPLGNNIEVVDQAAH